MSGRRRTVPWSGRAEWPPAKKGAEAQAIDRSRVGSAARIATLVDASGYLARFELVPGQAHDLVGVSPLLDGLETGAPVGDKAFDAEHGCWLVEKLEARSSVAAIPSKFNGKVLRSRDREIYEWRHQIENFLAQIKEFRTMATRYD